MVNIYGRKTKTVKMMVETYEITIKLMVLLDFDTDRWYPMINKRQTIIYSEDAIDMTDEKYIIPEYTTGTSIKEIRKSLGMTQKAFARFIGVSKPTVERWEGQTEKITGPIVALLEVLRRNPRLPLQFRIPDNRLKLRMYYMYKDMVCTIIDIDEVSREIEIHNYTDNIQYRAFGINAEPSFEDYEEFIESRCIPRTRDKLKLELDRLGIPFYDPVLIIEKTGGRMAEDDFWIRLER